MKKNIFITGVFVAAFSFTSYAMPGDLDKETQIQVVEKVKEYCKLMEEFSCDVEKIENLEIIASICENSNVSVFNDLGGASKRDISQNSMPMQQYMMMLTDKFENNVKTSHSGYKYIKAVVQPSPLKEFDATTYAFVKVDKEIKAPDINSKQHLNIIVNVAEMKVSSTISEDYEDPQSLYLEGLEKFNEGNYQEAIPLFEKVSEQQRFSGRYRAQTMLGWIYTKQREFQKANDILRISSQSDPLGGVILASEILMREDVPVTLRNYTEGMDILQKLSEVKSSDYPIHLIAKSAIFDAILDINNMGQKINLQTSKFDMGKIVDEFLNDPQTVDAFRVRGYIGKASETSMKGDKNKLEEEKKNLEIASQLLKTCHFDKEKFEQLDELIYTIKLSLLTKLGDNEGVAAWVKENLEKPYVLRATADGCVVSNSNLNDALELYRKAAEKGDAYSAYIVSLSYFQWPDSLSIWEHAWLNNFVRMRDQKTVKGWLDFVGLLFDSQPKDREKFLKWNQKAIDGGEVYAMEDRAVCLVLENSPCEEIDIPQALTLICKAACVGLRSDSFNFFLVHSRALQIEEDANVPFESSETYKTLKKLSDEGNGAASYLLFCDVESILKNSVQARQYLEKAKDAYCFYAMNDYACRLLKEGNYEQAFNMFNQLTVFPRSGAYSSLGNIERDFRHDDTSAMKYYKLGRKDGDYVCSEAISDMLKDGRLGGMKLKTDNLTAARTYIREAHANYKWYRTLYADQIDSTLISLKEKEAVLDSLIALRDSNGNGASEVTPIAQLNTILDTAQDEDSRILLSETLLSELFATPKAVVKTVGTNGQTVVSTETAEDFLLRLATLNTDKRLTEVSSKKDKDGKYTELTVQLK